MLCASSLVLCNHRARPVTVATDVIDIALLIPMLIASSRLFFEIEPTVALFNHFSFFLFFFLRSLCLSSFSPFSSSLDIAAAKILKNYNLNITAFRPTSHIWSPHSTIYPMSSYDGHFNLELTLCSIRLTHSKVTVGAMQALCKVFSEASTGK